MTRYYLVMSRSPDGKPLVEHEITEQHARGLKRAGIHAEPREPVQDSAEQDKALFGW